MKAGMIAFGLLPILSFCFIYRFLRTRPFIHGNWRRLSFLQAAIIWGVLLVVGTELLSIMHAIQFGAVLCYWSMISFAFLMGAVPGKSSGWKSFDYWKNLTFFEKFVFFFLIAFVFLTGLDAFLACPNSWDAALYHMSRVVFWQQNHTVAHFPTPDFRQLFMPPWSEYAELHFQVLTMGDRFAPLVSWFSYLGIAIGASLIGELYGASRRQQLLMALSAITFPTAITEASGVRGDIVVSFWAVVFFTFLILSLRTGSWVDILGAGLSLGLGILSKGTMYLLAVPLLIWFLFESIQKFHWKKSLLAIVCILSLVLGMNGAYYWRNYQLIGSVVSQNDQQRVVTQHMNPPLIVSNLVKNVFSQLGTPFKGLNKKIELTVNSIHQWMHVDPLDPRSDYVRSPFTIFVATYEEEVTNCLQVLMIMLGGMGLFIYSLMMKKYELVRMLLALAIAFVYISSSILWSVNMTRFLLCLMVITLPLIFLWVGDKGWPRWVMWLLVFAMIGTAIPYVVNNGLRPMISKHKPNIFKTSRQEMYFLDNPVLREPYNKAINDVLGRSCYDIGIYMGYNDWDYPLWVLMQNKAKRPFRIEHVTLDKESPSQYPLGDFYPCAIIGIYSHEKNLSFNSSNFIIANDYGITKIYISDKNERQRIVPLRN